MGEVNTYHFVILPHIVLIGAMYIDKCSKVSHCVIWPIWPLYKINGYHDIGEAIW